MIYVNLKMALVVAVVLAVAIAIWWHQRPKVTLVSTAEVPVVTKVVPVIVPVAASETVPAL